MIATWQGREHRFLMDKTKKSKGERQKKRNLKDSNESGRPARDALPRKKKDRVETIRYRARLSRKDGHGGIILKKQRTSAGRGELERGDEPKARPKFQKKEGETLSANLDIAHERGGGGTIHS